MGVRVLTSNSNDLFGSKIARKKGFTRPHEKLEDTKWSSKENTTIHRTTSVTTAYMSIISTSPTSLTVARKMLPLNPPEELCARIVTIEGHIL